MMLRCTIHAAVVFALAASAQATDLKDVEYGHGGKTSLRFDAHIPDGEGPFPAAIMAHGGGWVRGDRSSVDPIFEPLTNAGIAWFTVSYRLAGDLLKDPQSSVMQLGAAEKDIKQAIAFVRAHAAEYRIDPNKIVLIGESAGGQLVAMAGLRPDPGEGVQGVVAFYSPTDLATLVRTSSWIPESVREAMRGKLWDTLLMAELTRFSPITWASSSAPPFLMIHGTDDNLIPFAQSERFCDKLNEAGGRCELYPVKIAGHGMRSWESSHIVAYKAPMVRWIQRVLALK
jgi:alpha-L-fucosidase 2